MLRAGIYTLYDLDKLRINQSGQIELEDKLLESLYGELKGKTITTPISADQQPSMRRYTSAFTGNNSISDMWERHVGKQKTPNAITY